MKNFKNGWYRSPTTAGWLYTAWVNNELQLCSWYSPSVKDLNLTGRVIDGSMQSFLLSHIPSLKDQTDKILATEDFSRVCHIEKDLTGRQVGYATTATWPAGQEAGWYRIPNSDTDSLIWGLFKDGIWEKFICVEDPEIPIHGKVAILNSSAESIEKFGALPSDTEQLEIGRPKILSHTDPRVKNIYEKPFMGSKTRLAAKDRKKFENAWYRLPYPYDTCYALHLNGEWSHFIATGSSKVGDATTASWVPLDPNEIPKDKLQWYRHTPESFGIESFWAWKREDFTLWTDVVADNASKGSAADLKDGWYTVSNLPHIALARVGGRWVSAYNNKRAITASPSPKMHTLAKEQLLSLEQLPLKEMGVHLDCSAGFTYFGRITYDAKGNRVAGARTPKTFGFKDGWYRVNTAHGRYSNSELFGAVKDGKWVGWVYGANCALENLSQAPMWPESAAAEEFMLADEWKEHDFAFVRQFTHDQKGNPISKVSAPTAEAKLTDMLGVLERGEYTVFFQSTPKTQAPAAQASKRQPIKIDLENGWWTPDKDSGYDHLQIAVVNGEIVSFWAKFWPWNDGEAPQDLSKMADILKGRGAASYWEHDLIQHLANFGSFRFEFSKVITHDGNGKEIALPKKEAASVIKEESGISMWMAAPLGLLAVAALSAGKKSKAKRKVVQKVVNAEHGIT